VMNASPFDLEKQASRLSLLRERATQLALPIVYLNSVGGQDELVFDGGSMVLAADGQVCQQLPAFATALATVTFNAGQPISQPLAPALSQEASVYLALKLGLADYVAKNRFPGVVLGLSGGVDSALTMAIAVDALGADKVHAVLMPSEFTANISVDDAIDMAKRLGVKYSILPISPLFEGFKAALADEFAGRPFDTTEENLQARIRGMLLMALSNKFGSMVLTTGNKSEMPLAIALCTGTWRAALPFSKTSSKPWFTACVATAIVSPRSSPNALSRGRRQPSCVPIKRIKTACQTTRYWMP
jgi:NAD+ synthase (glutamine-hydrolysing)